jgi:hypothetical protein
MKLFLDGRELTPDSPDLAGAVAAACRAAEMTGRIVVEAELDGEPLAGEMLADPASAGRTGAEVRLTSADPRSLVLTTLLDVADALEGAREGQREAAEKIQSGQLDAAMERLGQALGVWEQARQVVVHGCDLLGISPHTAVKAAGDRAAGVTIAQQADILAGHLGEVKRCVEVRDWTGLADALLYDMDVQSQRWREMLTGLGDMVRGTRGC